MYDKCEWCKSPIEPLEVGGRIDLSYTCGSTLDLQSETCVRNELRRARTRIANLDTSARDILNENTHLLKANTRLMKFTGMI